MDSSQLPPSDSVSQWPSSAVGRPHSPWNGGSCTADPDSHARVRTEVGQEGRRADGVRFTTQEDQSTLWPSSSAVDHPSLSASIPCRPSGVSSSIAALCSASDAQPAHNQALGGAQDQPDEAEVEPVSGEVSQASATPMTEPLPSAGTASASAMTALEEAREDLTNMRAIIVHDNNASGQSGSSRDTISMNNLSYLPNEVLLQILGYLDVCDLLSTSRTSHRFRTLSLAPILHAHRLRQSRIILPSRLWSPSRPSLADLIRSHIFLTNTTVVSRKLARSLVCIKLSRRLACRPTPEALVARSVLPPECLPDRKVAVSPALVARKRAVERERVKDGLRRWIERVWTGEVRERSEGVRRWEERVGVGRVWRLTRFWERIGRETVADRH